MINLCKLIENFEKKTHYLKTFNGNGEQFANFFTTSGSNNKFATTQSVFIFFNLVVKKT